MERELRKDFKSARVSFNLPPQMTGEDGSVFTEVKYQQQDDEVFKLDPEIYRWEKF